MGHKEPKSMSEIHQIREKLWSRTQGMNLHERLAWFQKQARRGERLESRRQTKKAS